jgi:hypothetical protein
MLDNPPMHTPMDTNQTDAPARPAILDRAIAALRRLFRRGRDTEPVRDPGALRGFLYTRASFVAQMTLYGYLRTRAGARFPELFHDDQFIASTNIARWHVWLACLSDLAVYAGGMIRRNCAAPQADVGRLMCRLVDEILAENVSPDGAGPQYPDHAERVRTRLALCDWAAQADGDAPFVESPTALVYWAPIVDDLKVLDEEIVRNSVRYRWHEIRQQLRRMLDAPAVMAAADCGDRAAVAERAAPRA